MPNKADDAAPTSSVPATVPSHFQSFLAFDFGLKRTGVATGNRLLKTASPQATIKAEGDARFAHVEARIREWQPDALVIGVPFHPEYEVDERYSTTEALASGARDADAASACIILEQFLRSLS
mgnify:CR=1 FL=1